MEDTNALSEATLDKTFGDLDDLIKAVRASLPQAKPWQRQLHQYLDDFDRHLQITRMTIGMKRGDQEVAEAAGNLRTALRVAQRYVATGRADLGTKAAVVFACKLGEKIATDLDLQIDRAAG